MSEDQENQFKSEEPQVPHQFVANLIFEIKKVSGLSHSKLASALSSFVDMSDKMIAQYLSGNRTMGESRMLKLARAAAELGWKTKAVDEVLSWGKLRGIDDYVALDAFSKKDKKRAYRAQAAILNKFEFVIADLINAEWSDGEIIALAILLTEKYIPKDKRTCGGLIDAAKLHAFISPNDSVMHRDCKWLSWSFEGMAEPIPEK